jgi:transposase
MSMMGKKQRHFAPLSTISLEELVLQDHFYRLLELTLDLSLMREFVEKTYASSGRPSIDPIVFFKLQLVLFFEGLRSERQLMRHAADRLSVRWFLGYDLKESLPDHSSLTKIRTRYGIEVFRRFFDAVVELCQQAGLVWGRELYIDATKVQANASRDSVKPRFAVEAHLAELFAIEEEEQPVLVTPTKEPESVIPTPLPVALAEGTHQELAQHNEARHDWLEQEGAQDRSATSRNYQRVADFQMSTTDPDATIMLSKDGAHLGYQTHYIVDGGKARIILAALVAPAEVMANQPMLDLDFRSCFRWKLRSRPVTSDRKYGTEENIVTLETQHIRAYLALPDPDHPTAFFSSDRFC